MAIRDSLNRILNDIKDDDTNVKSQSTLKEAIETMKTKLHKDERDGENACILDLQAIREGIICLLASAVATDFVDTTNPNKVDIKVNRYETGKAMSSCLPWYDALCLT